MGERQLKVGDLFSTVQVRIAPFQITPDMIVRIMKLERGRVFYSYIAGDNKGLIATEKLFDQSEEDFLRATRFMPLPEVEVETKKYEPTIYPRRIIRCQQ